MSERNSALAVIHIAKKELGMEDEDYRAFLQEHTGKRSAADMNPKEHILVIRAFEKKGFMRKPRKQDRATYISLVKKRWHQLTRSINEQNSLRRFIFRLYHPKRELAELTYDQLRALHGHLKQGQRKW